MRVESRRERRRRQGWTRKGTKARGESEQMLKEETQEPLQGWEEGQEGLRNIEEPE